MAKLHQWRTTGGSIVTLPDEPQFIGQIDHNNKRKNWTYLGLSGSKKDKPIIKKKGGKQLWPTINGGVEVRERTINFIKDERPKVVLVVDTHDWSFADTAKQIAKRLSHRYQFAIVPMMAKPKHKKIKCDIVYSLWWGAYKELKEMYDAKYYIGNITDHYTPYQEAINFFDGWTVGNMQLFQELCKHVNSTRVRLIGVGVDVDLFSPVV